MNWRLEEMKQTIFIALSLLAFSAGAFAQDQAAIDKALLAAPAALKAGATVIKWKADYAYDTLKKGPTTWFATTNPECLARRQSWWNAPVRVIFPAPLRT